MRWTVLVAALWASLAWAGPVSLRAGDGRAVAADASGTGKRGVVLVPGEGRTRADWVEVGKSLMASGFQVVAVEVRKPDVDGSWSAAVQDVQAAVTWLRGRGVSSVSVVGVDLTGGVVLQAAAADAGISSVVVLSPRLSVAGLKVGEALAGLGDRPLLVVAGSADTTGLRAGGAMTQAGGSRHLEVIDGGAVGMDLFRAGPSLEGKLVGFFADPALAAGGPRDEALRAGDAGAIDTTGSRIGDQK